MKLDGSRIYQRPSSWEDEPVDWLDDDWPSLDQCEEEAIERFKAEGHEPTPAEVAARAAALFEGTEE